MASYEIDTYLFILYMNVHVFMVKFSKNFLQQEFDEAVYLNFIRMPI